MQDDKCRAPAGQVGNVVLLAEGGGQRDWDLLQSLCQPHHDAKTRRGRKAREDPSAMTLRFKTTYYCRHYGQKLGGQVPQAVADDSTSTPSPSATCADTER